ncbi:unnamed protein product [Mesocestoides corti]|uniref:Rho-GAP domain-containing protein n=1 Tax=Mesocestoides corti TaxID=53468 RepID=A0A0R3U9Z3_MESCO|nr:unnamed protein product [Mesocestoides corti]
MRRESAAVGGGEGDVEEHDKPRHRTTSIPEPVFTLFAFLARQGVHISDLFRRPGNINQMKNLIRLLGNSLHSTNSLPPSPPTNGVVVRLKVVLSAHGDPGRWILPIVRLFLTKPMTRVCNQLRKPTHARAHACAVASPALHAPVHLISPASAVRTAIFSRGWFGRTLGAVISSSLAKGELVDWSAYNVYTVANVAKRFLLSVPGGIFGEQNERRLLVAAVPLETGGSPRTATTQPSSHRLPPKLQHAPGFQSSGENQGLADVGSVERTIFVSSLFADKTGFLCDFGMLPPTPNERDQLNIFIEVLDSLPPPCRELAIIIFGILHSMVRHAGFEVTTGCHSCTPSTARGSSSRHSTLTLLAPHCSPPPAPPPSPPPPSPPPIRTLAEAVAKSVAGALLHTCPLSVDLVDRGAQLIWGRVVIESSPIRSTKTWLFIRMLHRYIDTLTKSKDQSIRHPGRSVFIATRKTAPSRSDFIDFPGSVPLLKPTTNSAMVMELANHGSQMSTSLILYFLATKFCC